MNRFLEQVTDVGRCRQLVEQMRCLVENSNRISCDYAKARGWILMPVESASHFNEVDAARISSACERIEVRECFAVATEQVEEERLFLHFQTSEAGILAFNQACAHFSYILFPQDDTFAILCTVADYYIIGGPTKVVAEMVGGDLTLARQEFLRFTSESVWSKSEGARLAEIAQYCSTCSKK